MSEPLLHVGGLVACYGQLQAVRGVSFDVGAGEALAVIGENGAGKTTLFHSICGLHGAAAGDVVFAGQQLRGVPAHDIVRRGVALVPEGRRIFPSLSVDENLRVAEDQHRRDRSRAPRRWSRDRVYGLFPDLKAASRRGGHQISGGQQQMLAIGRALLSDPRLLLLDEVAGGLTEAETADLCVVLDDIRRTGVALIWVEHGVTSLAGFVDRLLALDRGRVVAVGKPDEVLADPHVQRTYFGEHGGDEAGPAAAAGCATGAGEPPGGGAEAGP